MRSKRSSKNCMSAKAWEQGLRLLLFTICAIVKFNDESKRILRRAVTSCKASCASNFCWKRVSNTAERFGLQAFPSICRDAFPSFISGRIRWRLSAKNRPCDESRCLKVSPPLRSNVGVSNVVELCPMRTVRELLSPLEMNFAKFSRYCVREMERTGLLSFCKVRLPFIVLIDNPLTREAWWLMLRVGRMYSLKQFPDLVIADSWQICAPFPVEVVSVSKTINSYLMVLW